MLACHSVRSRKKWVEHRKQAGWVGGVPRAAEVEALGQAAVRKER